MLDQACELAATGLNQYGYLLIGIILVVAALGAGLWRRKLNPKLFVATFIVLGALMVSAPVSVSAATAAGCEPRASSTGSTSSSASEDSENLVSGLVDDFVWLDNNDVEPEILFGSIDILDNDVAPDGDPFDLTTLQFLGTPDPDWPYSFPIVDPNDPDVHWGAWASDVDCDPNDTVNCATYDAGTLDEYVACASEDGTGCWSTGYITSDIIDTAPTGAYILKYTIKTQSGATMAPATITMINPGPSPITAQDNDETYTALINCNPANPWNQDWSLDIMSLAATSGDAELLPSTIDLDPSTPGRQSTFTEGFTTFSVDEAGVVTMSSSFVGLPFVYPTHGFKYQIRDSNGTLSNWAVGLNVVKGHTCL